MVARAPLWQASVAGLAGRWSTTWSSSSTMYSVMRMQLKTQDLNDTIVTPKVCSMKCLQHPEVSICESLQAKTNDSYSRS
ncbi:hypothetical protein ZEAMMB73_Zm00001d004733 [Zea mays]|uniref:Uncharacterized protein n=1 Tax=Zea mays TaxID=4577 RepID=A0A1D6EH89_MAIZE|nr:hypothetical protein ZEAMMB73_Zm00001d004733 [Zea mays]